jgi:hypothetical protein
MNDGYQPSASPSNAKPPKGASALKTMRHQRNAARAEAKKYRVGLETIARITAYNPGPTFLLEGLVEHIESREAQAIAGGVARQILSHMVLP